MINLELRNITKIYPKNILAVNNVSFEIEAGKFFVLLGPSGCGKTSILRMIAGLEEITKGELLFGGKVVNNISPEQRNIGMVFQNYALYPHLTVYENLAFPLKVKKINNNEINQRVNEIAELINLTEFLNRKPKQLSGGQRQRVALGRALIRKPDVFLFDEPLSNLDAMLRVQMRTEIINLHRNAKTTSIYVTHDQTEAMTMGDILVILNNGIIQQIGTPQEIYEFPKNKFVAEFIGSPSMNFFFGEIIFDNSYFFYNKKYNLSIKIDGDIPNKYLNKQIFIGIRPEHFKILQTNDNQSIENSQFDVTNVEYLGYETFIHFKFGNENKIFRIEHNKDIMIGNKIIPVIQSDKIHIFNNDGERI